MSFTIMKYRAWESLAKKQSKFDDVLVFDEDFIAVNRAIATNVGSPDADVWLTFVDFAPTYKFEMTEHTLKLASYDEVISKANSWLARHSHLGSSSTQWTVLNCETLYAKVLMNIVNETGDVKGKRVAQISKWPLQDETFLNNFDPNQRLGNQNITLVLDGRFIVQILRLWLIRKTIDVVEMKGRVVPPKIGYRDYWPKMVLAKEGVKEFKSNKKVLEKMNEVTDRINLDITSGDIFTGPILNVISFPAYSTSGDNQSHLSSFEECEIKTDQIISVVRVFFDASVDARQEDLIGFADFIPECLSGGGFIKYPKFETQSKLVKKASRWLAENPEIKFLNSSSVDIKLKSMTSIDSSEMAFMRNTGDFIRILRICYTKPYESVDPDPEEITDTPGTSAPPPPPAPIYLNCRNIFSYKNSTTELKSKLYEFLRDGAFHESTDFSHRWRFLTAESVSIFTANNKKSDDIWENSFHAISISSSMMNRCAFDGINLFYDTGYFGQAEEEAEEGGSFGTGPELGAEVQPDGKAGSRALVPKRKRLPCTVL